MFEQYLAEFNQNIDVLEFLMNVVVGIVLIIVLRWYYIKFGKSTSNRVRFSNIFLPLGLTTLLIITIVKSSLALSLGLVGALSIVRFRSAIKDPEELVYLFLTIAIGLALGANQTILAVVGSGLILIALFIIGKTVTKAPVSTKDKLFLNISSSSKELEAITSVLMATLPYVELRRFEKVNDTTNCTFLIEAKQVADLSAVEKSLALAPSDQFSVIAQPTITA